MAKKRQQEVIEEVEDETTSDGSIATNDAWTGLLAISFLALVIGCGFFVYDLLYNYDASVIGGSTNVTDVKVPKFTGKPPGDPPKAEKKPVEEKKPEEKKPEDKNPDDKNPDDKKGGGARLQRPDRDWAAQWDAITPRTDAVLRVSYRRET